jgi:general stress protein 26
MRRNAQRWRALNSRLSRETTIWLVTVRPDDSPQLFPTWFVWLEEKLYFVVSAASDQYQSLRLNQKVAIALPDADKGIVIEGEAHTTDHQTSEILADYFYNKYEFDFSQDREIKWRLIEVTPEQILSWGDGYDHEGLQVL